GSCWESAENRGPESLNLDGPVSARGPPPATGSTTRSGITIRGEIPNRIDGALKKKRSGGPLLFGMVLWCSGLVLLELPLELLAGSGPGHGAGRDVDRFTRLWIPAHTRLPLARGEGPEPRDRHALSLLERRGDAADHRLQRARRLRFRNLGALLRKDLLD